GRRRDGEDAPLQRIFVQPAGGAAHELVVDGLGGEVHQREVVRAFGRPDVLRRDRVDVSLDVAGERTRVHRAVALVRRGNKPLEVVEGELRVDRNEPVDADDGIY